MYTCSQHPCNVWNVRAPPGEADMVAPPESSVVSVSVSGSGSGAGAAAVPGGVSGARDEGEVSSPLRAAAGELRFFAVFPDSTVLVDTLLRPRPFARACHSLVFLAIAEVCFLQGIMVM